MMEKISIKLILGGSFIFFLIMSFAHFLLIDRVGFWRLVYPLQAQFAIWSIHCNQDDTPLWMKDSLKYIIKNQKNLSNQIAYVNKQQKLYTCQSGWQKTAVFSQKINVDTRFRYASLTKLVTSDAILQLVNQNKLKTDQKVINFFPLLSDQPFKDRRITQITLADLLQHRSGFDRMKSEDVVFSLKKKSWCPKDLMQLINQKLDFEPNAKYAYDNRNYCLLGAVVEQVVGQDYRSYIQSQYHLNRRNIRFVDGYYFDDEVQYDFRNNDFWMDSDDNRFDFQALSSSAGLSGSAEQLALLMSEMLQHQPLNIRSIDAKILSECKLDSFKSCNGYAMWQYQKDENSAKVYFRNGGLPAVTSLAMVNNKDDVIVWIGNGATLYSKNHDENFLEKHFYETLSKKQ